MLKTVLITIAAAAAAVGVALATPAEAGAAPASTLDGARLVAGGPSDVQSKCWYDLAHANAAINYQATGTASGAYAGTFASTGTARLYTWGTPGLTELDATFTISSPAGSIKGTLQRVAYRTTGTGNCNEAASDATISASGVVYTASLPDGTIDQGVVELNLVDDPVSGAYSASFRSTSRIPDADLDGVLDGTDNCPTWPNADQRDMDADGLGDTCDLIDDRPALFDDLGVSSQAAAISKALIGRAEHARSAYFAGNVPGACADLAGYRDGVVSKRGKGIAPATADTLIGKADRIRTIIGCT